MKTEWDYTQLADAYLKRPDYSSTALSELFKTAQLKSGAQICDVGAGVGHLTRALAGLPGSQITAVEPNDAMRANGMRTLAHLKNVRWVEGTGEATGCPDRTYDLVTFGSSFNVTDQQAALRETARILKPRGWFACMWNHRDLEDPIQKRIEDTIKQYISDYSYGTRRQDQTAVIESSHLFGPVVRIEGGVRHEQKKTECVEAWRSHATLHRQSGDKFDSIISDIEVLLRDIPGDSITIPYVTRIWVAQLQ